MLSVKLHQQYEKDMAVNQNYKIHASENHKLIYG